MVKDVDATKMAVISAAVTAFLQAEHDAEAAAHAAPTDSVWARAGRASLMKRRAQMQWRPVCGRSWSTWAL